MDYTNGLFEPAVALRNIRGGYTLNANSNIKLVEYDDPNITDPTIKQYKVYDNDVEIRGTNSKGESVEERIFNQYGDIFRSEDILRGHLESTETPTPAPAPAPTPAPAPAPTPAPEITPINELSSERRLELEGFRNNLYYIGDTEVDNIIDGLNNEIQTALDDPTPLIPEYITLDFTRGNIPLAVAVRSVTNVPTSQLVSARFEQIDPTSYIPGADPAYYLYLNNEIINHPQTVTPKIYNRFGGRYTGRDQEGFNPVLKYPFRPSSGRQDLSVPETTVPETEWAESSNPTGQSEGDRREEQDLAFIRTGAGGIPLITKKDIDALSGALSSGWESFKDLVENSEEYKRQQRQAPTAPFTDKFDVVRQP
jgi:hypothetical protein